MDLSVVDDVSRYEADRRLVENAFFEAYSKWLKHLEGEIADEYGIPVLSVSDDLLTPFAEMVLGYAKGEIKAYLRQVGHLSNSEVLDSLQVHRGGVLEEIRTRKWAPAVARLSSSFNDGVFDQIWQRVESEINGFLWERFAPSLWKNAPQWPERTKASAIAADGVSQNEVQIDVIPRGNPRDEGRAHAEDSAVIDLPAKLRSQPYKEEWKQERSALVRQCISSRRMAGHSKFSFADIWTKAKYKSRTQPERWLNGRSGLKGVPPGSQCDREMRRVIRQIMAE